MPLCVYFSCGYPVPFTPVPSGLLFHCKARKTGRGGGGKDCKKVPDTFTNSYGVLFLVETRVARRSFFSQFGRWQRESQVGLTGPAFPSPMATLAKYRLSMKHTRFECVCRWKICVLNWVGQGVRFYSVCVCMSVVSKHEMREK